MRVAAQITPFWRSMDGRAGEQFGGHIGGYRTGAGTQMMTRWSQAA